jgi:hypothetical protein
MSEEKKEQKKEKKIRVVNTEHVDKMSHRQLVAELELAADQQYKGSKGFVLNGVDFGDYADRKSKNRASISNAEAIVSLIVLNNTEITAVKFKDGKPRKDQFGPGKLNAYPL